MYHVRAFLKHLQKNISPICEQVTMSVSYISDTCCVPTRNIVEGEIVLTSGDLLTLLLTNVTSVWVLADSIQRHMVTPASHPIGVGRPINHVKNKKYGNIVFISSLTGQCAAQKIKHFCSSSLWTCLHPMVILRSQNKITDFLMTLAWV